MTGPQVCYTLQLYQCFTNKPTGIILYTPQIVEFAALLVDWNTLGSAPGLGACLVAIVNTPLGVLAREPLHFTPWDAGMQPRVTLSSGHPEINICCVGFSTILDFIKVFLRYSFRQTHFSQIIFRHSLIKDFKFFESIHPANSQSTSVAKLPNRRRTHISGALSCIYTKTLKGDPDKNAPFYHLGAL